jgi:hypothetical protein
MNRRSYLLALGSTSLIGLSGCLGGQNGYIRPDDDPTSVPAEFNCGDEEYERLWTGYEPNGLNWGDTEDFSLRVNGLSFEYGDVAEISLSPGMTGNRHKWNFEVYTENGWKEVRGTNDGSDLVYTDEGVSGGFTWNLELTEEGILEASPENTNLRVCPDFLSGRYRFVYWGLTGDESVAVSFDIDI